MLAQNKICLAWISTDLVLLKDKKLLDVYMNKEIKQIVVQLAKAGQAAGLIKQEDLIYVINRLAARLGLAGFMADSISSNTASSIPQLLEDLAEAAQNQGLLPDSSAEKEILLAELMDIFLDKPAQIQAKFDQLYQQSPQAATNWFYELGQSSNYIQTRQIARNIVYQADSPYGSWDITINLSKPEKSPRDIAAALLAPSSSYPLCQLCVENEGYQGRLDYPARANHRMIRLSLAGEPWYMQYSPYVYYPEHCIVLAHDHQPIRISQATLRNLLLFLDHFPHYFIGSNADLPIVGGSILTHDHYQGGHYELPMARAKSSFMFALPNFVSLSAWVLAWPLTVIRLRTADRAELLAAASLILQVWRSYSDPDLDIIAEDEAGPHNTITPIARRRGADYELDLVLRNNRQDEEHPAGIFHPHADVQHIKQENIGLIEVMGLAVLPARLATELEQVELFLQDLPAKVAGIHLDWARQLRRQQPVALTADQAVGLVRQAVADKFTKVLENAGVYKQNTAGQAGLRRFLSAFGAELKKE